jgi:hypothetical protein
MRRPIMFLVAAGLLALGACGSSSDEAASETSTPTTVPGVVVWPRPDNTMDLADAAGLVIDDEEHLDFHEHSLLKVTLDGEAVQVPANIGVGESTISELHTHDASGTLHLESASEISFTLGNFFDTWNVGLSETCVGDYCTPEQTVTFTVDGKPYTGDPREIELRDEVLVEIDITTA